MAQAVRRAFYTRAEISKHNTRSDCWLIIFNKVFDVSHLVCTQPYELCEPLVLNAGEDISHWFTRSADGGIELKTFIDPVTNVRTPFLPQGRFVHVPAIAPSAGEAVLEGLPWWQDEAQYNVGQLTRQARKLRIVNTLTSQEHIVEFGVEETVAEMQAKYREWNSHSEGYVWKAILKGSGGAGEGAEGAAASSSFQPLDPSKTLDENGVPDDTKELEALGLDPDHPDNFTCIMLLFKDDLSEA